MVIEGITFCDFCGDAAFPDDTTTVKIEVRGTLHQFHFHNRNARDCLAQNLVALKQQFAASTQ
ncbi:MAG TPA: hypothetical protein VGG72_21540 [Bryobacteraceae bacterium]|jgi:hypothetical protein